METPNHVFSYKCKVNVNKNLKNLTNKHNVMDPRSINK